MKLAIVTLASVFLVVSGVPLLRAQGEKNLINMDYFDEGADLPVRQAKSNIQWAHIDPVAKLIREGNLSYAFENIEFALRYFPNHPAALHLLGIVAQLQQKPSLPIVYYEKAIKLFPQYALTHAQYGGYLVSIGNIQVGLARLNQSVEIDPKLAMAHVLLAKAYAKSGNIELARQEAEQARALGYEGKIE